MFSLFCASIYDGIVMLPSKNSPNKSQYASLGGKLVHVTACPCDTKDESAGLASSPLTITHLGHAFD